MKRTEGSTAAKAYQEAQVAARTELARLAAALVEHAEHQQGDPQSWGFVGDLTSLAAALRDLLPGPPGGTATDKLARRAAERVARERLGMGSKRTCPGG